MAKVNFAFSNFTAGELSPRLGGRTDLSKYYNGCNLLENFLVHPHGGVSRRPGTRFVALCKTGFSGSATVTVTDYANIAVGTTLKLTKSDGGIVTFTSEASSGSAPAETLGFRPNESNDTTADNIYTAINAHADFTVANPAANVVTITETASFDYGVLAVESTDAVRLAVTSQVELKSRLLAFQFNVEQAYILEFYNNGFRIFKDGGQVTSGSPASAVEVTTTYTTAQLPDLKFAQSADVMYVVHPSHPVRKISRTSHTAWTIADVDFARGPFLDVNTTTTTMTASAATGSSITITASAVTGVNAGDGFTAAVDVGRLIKLHHGFAKITAVTDTTHCTATAQENENFIAELEPAYTASTIGLVEGDPSATGLEHNDRITDSAKQFVEEGFERGMTITVSGAGTSANNGDYLIVAVSEDMMLISPSDDCVTEAASSSITVVGKLVADKEWRLGAFYIASYPAAVTFYEQRLVLAATGNQPQTIFFSVGADFENFTPGTDADSALTYQIGSNFVNVIRYLSSSRSLLVGTSGGEFAVRASGTDEPLSPINAQIKQQSAYGAANMQPVQVGNAVLFLQRALRKIRELTYNYDSDSYVAPDLTILSEHITEGGLSELAFQQEPDNIVWGIRADGILAGMTYRREEQVVAWHRHKIGGISGAATVTATDYVNIAVGTTLKLTKSDGSTVTFTSEAVSGSAPAETLGFRPNESNDTTADNIFTAINAHADFTVANPAANVVTIIETTRAGNGFLSIASTDDVRLAVTSQSNALVESVATIPATDEDEVWIIVQRTINGATKRYIEYMKSFDFGTDIEDAFFVDSGLTYDSTAATTLSGLDHLEAENMHIITNGSTHTNQTVASGAVSLTRSTTKAHVGLPFASTLQTMRLEAGATDGTAQGKVKRIDEVTVRLYRTVNALVGGDTSTLDRISFRSGADPMDAAIPLFTGDKQIELPSGFDQDGYVVVQQDLALPMTLIAVIARAQTFD